MACLRGCEYPIVIVNNDCENSRREFSCYLEYLRSDRVDVIFADRDGWDTQLLHAMMEETGYEEWLFLHDTCVVLDHALMDMVFKDHAGRSVSLFPWYRNFIGKYTRVDLEAFPPPTCTSKREAFLAEMRWCPEYEKRSQSVRLFLADGSTDLMMELMGEAHGKKVMMIGNEYFIKYKHSWRVPDAWQAELTATDNTFVGNTPGDVYQQ